MANKEEELYYIQDTRSVVGDCVLWWGPDGNGYTLNIERAGLYTYKQASSHRETDVPWPKSMVDSLISSHVHIDSLRTVPTVEVKRWKGDWYKTTHQVVRTTETQILISCGQREERYSRKTGRRVGASKQGLRSARLPRIEKRELKWLESRLTNTWNKKR